MKINHNYWKHLGPQYPQFPALCFPFALTAVENQRQSAEYLLETVSGTISPTLYKKKDKNLGERFLAKT
jgi:hypothetical protein